MIDDLNGTELTVGDFYDALASTYDFMTGFQNRFIQEKPFFRLLVERYDIKKALDAGCGTGFHSLLLAQMGVAMTAVDVSPEMLRKVRQHAHELSVHIEVLESRFQDLRRKVDAHFDAVLSLGNSLSHLSTELDLQESLASFHSILKPQGILFLQNLNYDRVLATKDRVQSIKESDGKTFVRYYDYAEGLVLFNILTVEKEQGVIHQNLRSVKLKPWLSQELQKLISEAGFVDVGMFGGISMEEYRRDSSKDLVILARRKA